MKHYDASAWMQHTTFYLIQKIKQGFPYTIFPVKKINVGNFFKIMIKSLFNYSLYSHPEIGNFRVWHSLDSLARLRPFAGCPRPPPAAARPWDLPGSAPLPPAGPSSCRRLKAGAALLLNPNHTSPVSPSHAHRHPCGVRSNGAFVQFAGKIRHPWSHCHRPFRAPPHGSPI
jgi:hypothetical protein